MKPSTPEPAPSSAAAGPGGRWTRLGMGVAALVGLAVVLGLGIPWLRDAGTSPEVREVRRAVAERRYDEAEAPLQRWRQAQPRSAEAQYLSAYVALMQDRPQEAVESLHRARTLGHAEPELQRLEAILRARMGRHAEAEPVLRRVLARSSRPDPEAAEALARVYLETFQLSRASQVLQRWMREAPDDPKPYLWMIEIDQRTDAEPSEIAERYREVLRRDPDRLEARLGLAEMLRLSHRHDEAAREFTAYLERRPDDPDAHLGMGRNALKRGDEATAVTHFERAIELAPDDPEPLIERAAIALRRGDAADALAMLDRAITLEPHESDPHYQRGLALARLGRRDEAREAHAQADRIRAANERMLKIRDRLISNPDDVAFQLEAATWMMEHGQEHEGIRWLEQIVRHHPNQPQANHMLAEYYRRQGNLGLANFYRLRSGASPATGSDDEP